MLLLYAFLYSDRLSGLWSVLQIRLSIRDSNALRPILDIKPGKPSIGDRAICAHEDVPPAPNLRMGTAHEEGPYPWFNDYDRAVLPSLHAYLPQILESYA